MSGAAEVERDLDQLEIDGDEATVSGEVGREQKRPFAPGAAVHARVGAWRKKRPSTVTGRSPAASGLPQSHPFVEVRRYAVQLS